jgi:hypothetical protein
MIYQTRTITRDLKSIPFDKAFRLCEDAVELAIQTQEQLLEQKFQEQVSQLEQAWTDTHEAPSEVSFADQIDYPKLDRTEIARQTRQRTIIEEFIPQYKLDTTLQLYTMPEIIRWIARNFSEQWLREVMTAEGQIDGRKAANAIFDFSQDWDKGLYYFLMLDSRSSYLKTQYKGDAKNYCGIVPLILYAFKLLHSIPYSKWDKSTLHFVVNRSLCDAMLCEVPEVTREELLEIREMGLVFKTGDKAGTTKNPVSAYKLTGVGSTKIGALPELAQTMLTQIWCAHPTNRTKFMVLDPRNWDHLPTPLIAEQLFAPIVQERTSRKKQSTKDDNSYDLPWNV